MGKLANRSRMMEGSRKLIILGAATAAVMALGSAWIAGMFDRSTAPDGAIAEDSVTIAVGDRGPLEQLASPAVLAVGILMIALVAAVTLVVKRRKNRASAPPNERRRHG